MFLVPNIDQMYKEVKKIVEVGNIQGNGDEFPDFADLFIFGIKNVRVGRSNGNTHIFFLTQYHWERSNEAVIIIIDNYFNFYLLYFYILLKAW